MAFSRDIRSYWTVTYLRRGDARRRTILGVSWSAPEPQRQIVRRVIAFVEDPRVLYNPYNIEIDREVSTSAFEIRGELTKAIPTLPEDSPAAHATHDARRVPPRRAASISTSI